VVKPGFIIGTADSGFSNTDNILWRVVATAAAMKVFPDDPAGTWLYVSSVDDIATRVTTQLFATGSITAFVDIIDGMLLSKFWELVREELALASPSVPWDDWVQVATRQMNEQHPILSVQHILSYRPVLTTQPPGAQEYLETHIALKRCVRYLVLSGFIQLSEGYGRGV
ncbi:hypothetical protein V500_01123, partial [Pseudogymnoascus sp. VKM F-4518 (FW-2643)]